MAKDPAMLWYWGDWNSGTTLLSRFLKGCYMDLLHAQFNNGPLSLEEVKAVLGGDFGQSWPSLQKKFSIDPTGLFFNERLEFEKNKRKAFTDSRSKNRLKKSYDDTYENHMNDHMIHHMENENENKDKPIQTLSINSLTDFEIQKTIEFVKITSNKLFTLEQIQEYWAAFLIVNEKEYYANNGKRIEHFRHWLKKQNFTNGNNKTLNQTGSSKEPGSVSRSNIEALRNW